MLVYILRVLLALGASSLLCLSSCLTEPEEKKAKNKETGLVGLWTANTHYGENARAIYLKLMSDGTALYAIGRRGSIPGYGWISKTGKSSYTREGNTLKSKSIWEINDREIIGLDEYKMSLKSGYHILDFYRLESDDEDLEPFFRPYFAKASDFQGMWRLVFGAFKDSVTSPDGYDIKSTFTLNFLPDGSVQAKDRRRDEYSLKLLEGIRKYSFADGVLSFTMYDARIIQVQVIKLQKDKFFLMMKYENDYELLGFARV